MASVESKSLRNLNDKQALERVMGDIEDAKSAKKDDIERNQRYRRIYEALDDPDDRIDETTGQIEDDESIYSNTYMPLGAALVDAGTSKTFNQIFSTDDYFKIAASNWEDELYALRNTAHMKQQHREMKYRYRVLQALQQMFSFDYCVTMIRWHVKSGFVPKTEVERSFLNLGGVKVQHQRADTKMRWTPYKIDRPDLVIFPFFRCYHDESSIDGLEGSKYFIDERDEDFDTLRDLEKTKDKPWGRYKNVTAVIKAAAKGDGDKEVDDPVDRQGQQKKRRATISRYWTHDHVVEISHGKIIHRSDLTSMPLHLWKLFELPGEFRGMGLLQRIERNQRNMNAAVNQVTDFRNLVNNPIGAVSDEIATNEDGNIDIYPGVTFVTGGDPNKAFAFHTVGPDITLGAIATINLETDMMRTVSRVSENTSGQFTSGRRSATEAREVAQGVDEGTFVVAAKIEETVIVPILTEQFILNQTMMTSEDAVKYMAEGAYEFFTIKPSDYRWGHTPRFFATGSTYIQYDEVKKQQFMAGYDRALAAPQLHNMEALTLKMWQLLDPQDFQRFVRDPRKKSYNAPPAMENFMMAHGHKAQVSPENNHSEHIASHAALETTPDYKFWPDQFKQNLREHQQGHQAMMTQGGGRTNSLSEAGPGQGPADALRGIRGPTLGVTQ